MERRRAAVVFNRELTIMKLDHLSGEHMVCVQVKKRLLSTYLVCAYFQFSSDIDPYIERIREILISLRGKKIILGIDANAESSLWFSKGSNNRGRTLEDFIVEMRLFGINGRSSLYTFPGINRESNINVTFTTDTAVRLLETWEVKEEWT